MTNTRDSLAEAVNDKTVAELFESVDKDHSGKIDKEEFGELHARIVKTTLRNVTIQKEKDRAYKMLGVGAVALLLLLAALAGMGFAVNYAMKEQYVEKAVIADDSGTILGVSRSVVKLPLIAAPVVPIEQLSDVKRLVLTTSREGFEDGVQLVVNVIQIERFNNTATIFHGSRGEAVHVWNGHTFVEMGSGETHAICAADISCSALTVSDLDSAEGIAHEAYDALNAAGFLPPDQNGIQDGRALEYGYDCGSRRALGYGYGYYGGYCRCGGYGGYRSGYYGYYRAG